MIDFDNRTERVFSLSLIEQIAKELTDRDIELILTDNHEIKEINREYRAIDKATDVLSFPSDPFPFAPLGSIVISIDKVSEIASLYKHSESDELTLLFIHGLLHLLGMDHETDKGEMREAEMRLIEQYNLPKSLIVRTFDV